MKEDDSQDTLSEVTGSEYKYGFETIIEMDTIPKGLNEDVIKVISKKKNEPEFMLEFRLKAFKKWQEMEMPNWAHLDIPPIDFQDISYYAAPKKNEKKSMDEVDPELIDTFNKLGIPLEEQLVLAGVAVDAVFDSVSVKTTMQDKLKEL